MDLAQFNSVLTFQTSKLQLIKMTQSKHIDTKWAYLNKGEELVLKSPH
jgi:hypothetical protein